MGFAGAMITEYPPEDRRYDQPEYEPFWAAAQALNMPLSLHTATRRQGKIRGAGERTLRDASSRATQVFYPATSMCNMIFAGVFERYPNLKLAIVEFEPAWVPHLLASMDYTYRERHEEALYESIPLLVCGSRYGSWQSPEMPQSRPQCAPSGPPSGDISSGTRPTCAPLGIAGPLF
jgi:hypothetical protein